MAAADCAEVAAEGGDGAACYLAVFPFEVDFKAASCAEAFEVAVCPFFREGRQEVNASSV